MHLSESNSVTSAPSSSAIGSVAKRAELALRTISDSELCARPCRATRAIRRMRRLSHMSVRQSLGNHDIFANTIPFIQVRDEECPGTENRGITPAPAQICDTGRLRPVLLGLDILPAARIRRDLPCRDGRAAITSVRPSPQRNASLPVSACQRSAATSKWRGLISIAKTRRALASPP